MSQRIRCTLASEGICSVAKSQGFTEINDT
uniref:Uncharacterized protein MANES_04G000300 n=1 Tax=Rhizophora mucronata TaxID=61149 RepID=A0A2P2P8D2_RHIMU